MTRKTYMDKLWRGVWCTATLLLLSLPHAAAQQSPRLHACSPDDIALLAGAARTARLDTLPPVRQALDRMRRNMVRQQLAKDPALTAAARRQYQRLQTDGKGTQVRVRHILRRLPQNASRAHIAAETARMDSLHRLLAHGAPFDSLWQAFSDDHRTWWATRAMAPAEFEEAAFSLERGACSAPFFSPEGIHIVQVTDRRSLPPFELIADSLALDLLKRPTPGHATLDSLVGRLRHTLGYRLEPKAMDELTARGQTQLTLFHLGEKAYTGADFARYAASHPAGIRRQLKGFVTKSILDQADRQMELQHPDWAHTLHMRQDSLLAQVVLHAEVERKLADEAALQTYFEQHRRDYQWDTPRYRGIVLHGTTKRVLRQARKLLKALPQSEWQNALRLMFNHDGQVQVLAQQGTFAPGDNPFADHEIFGRKAKADPPAGFTCTRLLGKKLKGPESYREIRDTVARDCRHALTLQLLARLQQGGKVEINQEDLKTVNNH